MSLARSALCLLAISCVAVCIVSAAGAALEKQQYDMDAPITAYKRFYSWEDAKRAASSEEGIRNKRKQFYAWAGKRSSAPVHFFEDIAAQEEAGPSMEKRKQFYAWAGK
ncbi:hypothetical protein CRE_24465 [Caenorhabditis remanei]|uniref:Uncharacterized protein n=1 Tax=Caenorhabditis remanei TaxID=31234 RepID=E3MFS6_CAERE|nr:hypothetical protein CRE_24465 [Caenorhabditis remanei]